MLNTGTIKEIDKTGEKQTVKFFSPLKITTYHSYEHGDYSADDLPEEIPSSEAVRYMDEILAAIEKEKLPNEGNRSLIVYFDKDKALVQKVYGLNLTVEEWNGELWGVMEAEVYGKLTKAETVELVEFSVGQFADGWGESFEQHPIKTQDGEIYVSFWNSENFFIQPEQKLKQNAEPDLGCNMQTMGGLKMSKIFSVVGLETNTGIQDGGLIGGIPDREDVEDSDLYRKLVEDCGGSEYINVTVSSYCYGEGESENTSEKDLKWTNHSRILKTATRSHPFRIPASPYYIPIRDSTSYSAFWFL